jgi:hypothetical protein
MLRMLHYPGYPHGPQATHRTGPTLLPAFWSALREALAGARDYRALRSRGVSHDAAIRHALGIGMNQTHPPKPLHFAGRA